ncbi:IucA/IucC family C-terminal-domain containing protein [Rickettsiella massiliensis]|uniref:IucA/IucC family C-terminal-domain containing protein n=1 Tax=Rickettsiella massiliensis TaxID=676517 RepID=UPI000496DB4A|nr:IucA/IucC family C-terminal-domain containing protein [Rickettsiella massiliensis]
MPELYGLHLPAFQENKSQNFSAIFRENIAISLQPGQVAVVTASFFEQGIDRKNNLFIELMQLAGYTTYQEALSYFHHYVDLVLGGYLNLYLLYGVALEGHQQNTFAVFQKGKLTRFIARDLEGICIHPQTLNSRGFDLDIAENSPQIKSDRALVRNNLLYSVYQLHLGEIILLITDHFGCAEDAFWQIIKKVTLQTLMCLKNQFDESLWKAEYNAILVSYLVSYWPLKALLRMRLNKNIPEGILFNSIANPFASLCAS